MKTTEFKRLIKEGGVMKLIQVTIFLSVFWLFFCVFLPSCNVNDKEELPSRNHSFFQGKHELQKLITAQESFNKFNGDIFLISGKGGIENKVKFSWKNNKNEFMLTVLPYNKVRVVINNYIEKPYCKFKWSPTGCRKWYMNWEDYVIYVVIFLKENQFKYEVNLKM